MIDQAAIETPIVPLADALAPVATLLAGVPTVTVLVMAAVRYVASGTL